MRRGGPRRWLLVFPDLTIQVWGNTRDLAHQQLEKVLAAVIPHIVALQPVNNNPDELVGF